MPKLSHMSPILAIRELSAAVEYYEKTLGFKAAMTTDSPMPYAILERDGVMVHLTVDDMRRGKGAFYVMIDDVDAFYEEVKAKNANVVEPPDDRVYGMRDMYLRDPDHNLLGFGQPLGQ